MEDLDNTLKMVRLIKIDMNNGMDRNELYHKYTKFSADKPKTFALTLDGRFDEKQFVDFKNEYETSLKNATSDNKPLEATTNLGKMIADKFLHPSLESLDK